VGLNPEETADHLLEVLFKQSAYSSYMRHIVCQMTSNTTSDVIHPLRYLPYNVRNIIIPTESNEFVYLLLSLRDHNTTYIGQTKNLSKRLLQHNSGFGAVVTANPKLRPWHIIGFITGFDGNKKQERILIEQCWQTKRNVIRKYSLNPLEVLQIGKDIVHDRNENYHGRSRLTFIQCIKFKAYD
jgi:predicted GIY-YIG superfamily endonuclease